jgi:DNA-binding transcriptional MerR regulator
MSPQSADRRRHRPGQGANHPRTTELHPGGSSDEQVGGVYIKQAARFVGVSPATIRAWERQGLVAPKRTQAGYRVYSQADIRRLRRVRDLFQAGGLNGAGVRHVLHLSGEDLLTHGGADPSDSPLVGRRIRQLRTRMRISVRELAARTDLSPSYVSSIERSLSRPSIASLQKLAAGLGINLSQMLDERPEAYSQEVVVRPHERRRLQLDEPGIVLEQLAVVEQDLEPSMMRIAPDAGSGEAYSHDGEEFIFVLEGKFEITLDETHEYLLESGDAITFRSRRPHRWRNPGESETLLIWVNTPPTF